MQISEHRINAVNAKKLPENRPQNRRRYRRPKLTTNVSLQAGQKTPKFSPIFLPTQDVDPYFSPILFHPFFFHPYFFHPFFFTHTFYKAFTHTFFTHSFLTHTFYKVFTHAFYKVSSILLFTHSFFHPYFLESFHPYFISPILFSPMVFTKFSYFCFTHTFFHPSINQHNFHQVFNTHVFFNYVFSLMFIAKFSRERTPHV